MNMCPLFIMCGVQIWSLLMETCDYVAVKKYQIWHDMFYAACETKCVATSFVVITYSSVECKDFDEKS